MKEFLNYLGIGEKGFVVGGWGEVGGYTKSWGVEK